MNIVQLPKRHFRFSFLQVGQYFNSGLVHENNSAYATGSLGLPYFTTQQIVSPFPLSTMTTILSKRLSRPAASAFNLLGSIVTYCLKDKIIYGTKKRIVSRFPQFNAQQPCFWVGGPSLPHFFSQDDQLGWVWLDFPRTLIVGGAS